MDIDSDAERAIEACAAGGRRISRAASFGWLHEVDGVQAFSSTARHPFGNGVVVGRRDTAPEVVVTLLDEVAATGLPFCLQVRAGADPRIEQLAGERGMQHVSDQPLLVNAALDAAPAAAAVESLEVREVSSAETELYAELMAAGFGAPREVFRVFAHPSVLRAEGLRSYIAYVGGEPAATAAGHTVGEGVVISNVSTLEAFRRRGIGAAITQRAIADGVAAGATFACLFSSPDGHGIYTRMGFHEVETFRIWVEETSATNGDGLIPLAENGAGPAGEGL